MSDDAVTVAYLHPNNVPHSWHDSFTGLLGWDLEHERRVLRGGWLGMKCGAGGLDQARDLTVRRWLAERDAEWLWWVDADMGFAPDTVDRLLEAADPHERPIMGGLCFALQEREMDGMGGFRTSPRPTLFDWVRRPDGVMGFAGRTGYPVGEVVRVGGTGSACLLVHRSVFDRIDAVAPEPGRWYQRTRNPSSGELIGEDLSFCLRAAAAGIPVHVHTGVRTTHQKTIWLAESDYWGQVVPPPAVERVSVIVPVLRRPQAAEPFMRSLRASTGLATVVAVVDEDDDDTARAWEAAGASIVRWPGPERGTFARKANLGCRASASEPWVFLAGDDVRFHAGWLDHAQAVAAAHGAKVVGTNDLANPRVTSGEHATHLLISREHIDAEGASWDGPGVVAHEGYGHWFVDDEIVAAAKERGVWAMALGSRVEHLHPAWGTAPDDGTYRLGASTVDEDRALFAKRAGGDR